MIVVTGYDTGYDPTAYGPIFSKSRMIHWILVIFISVIVFFSALPWLEKLDIGRLPDELRLTLLGKKFSLPFSSTVLLN